MSKVRLASGLRVEKKQKKQTNKQKTTITKHAVAGHFSAGSKLKALFVTLEINLRRLVLNRLKELLVASIIQYLQALL